MTDDWGPFHRHFANDAIHRDGGPECDQPGSPRRVYVFDPDYLKEHEEAIRTNERNALRAKVEALRFTKSGGYGDALRDVLDLIDGSSDAG